MEIWNRIPGVKPVQKFTDRKTAMDRIWKAIQPLATEDTSRLGPKSILRPQQPRKVRRQKRAILKIGKRREGSKKALILQLLKRPAGVTLQELMAVTGWQAHSVRGFISAGGKRMGWHVVSSKREDGKRVYQIR